MDHPKRPIADQAAALENMVLVRDLLARRGIRVFLSFGTLLGAVRDKGFIPYDDDVDLGVFADDADSFRAAIPELAAQGLRLAQRWSNGRFFAFERKGEPLDIFTAVKVRRITGMRWDLDTRVSVPCRHLDTLERIDFLGESFYAPADPESYLFSLYGRNWRIPIRECPSRFDLLAYASRLAADPAKLVYFAKRFMRSIAARLGLAGRNPSP